MNLQVNVKWAADYGKGWVVGIWLVEKLSSEQVHLLKEVQTEIHNATFPRQLLDRLSGKGKRQPEFTRELIKKKLTGWLFVVCFVTLVMF